MQKLLSLFILGILSLTAHAAPLLINGTGGLEPEVLYDPGDPEMLMNPNLTFKETFTDIPATLNTEGVTDYIQLTLSAPEGYRFTVAAHTNLHIGVFYVYGTGADIGFSMSAPVQVSYTALVGNAPTWESSSSTWVQGFAFSLGSSTEEAFSFTSIILTMPISGIGLNSIVKDNGDHQLSVSQDPYAGEAPPNETVLLTVTAIPEPSSIWFGVAGLCGLLALKRRKQTC